MRPAVKAEPPKPAPKLPTRPQVLRPKQFLWAFPPEPPYADKARPARNAPAVDAEGRIYLCTQGRLYALTQDGGKANVVWEYVIGAHVPGPVVAAPDGTLRVHGADGLLHCVNSAGKQEWPPANVGQPLGWAAPVIDDRGNTYICGYEGGLLRVDAEGKLGPRPFFPSRRKFDSTGVILRNVLIVGSEDGYVFAVGLDEDRGRNLWDHSLDFGYAGGVVNSAPAVSDDGGIIVVAARDQNLSGFAPNGAKAWNVKLPGQLLGSPVIGPDGHILVGVSQAPRGQKARGSLVCVDGNSHKIRWQYSADDAIESTPAIGDDGLIYFGDNSGAIHAVDASGESLWKARVESPVRSAATLVAPGQVAFGLDDDTMVVLQCASRKLAPAGWPKLARNLAQSGLVSAEAKGPTEV
ncbi:MAG: outer membrane protein assembly factor BamB family protein [Thermoguttaceae bacterium]